MAVYQQTGENDDDKDKDAKYYPLSGTRGGSDIIIVESLFRALFAAGFFVVKKFVAHRMGWDLFLVLPQGDLL